MQQDQVREAPVRTQPGSPGVETVAQTHRGSSSVAGSASVSPDRHLVSHYTHIRDRHSELRMASVLGVARMVGTNYGRCELRIRVYLMNQKLIEQEKIAAAAAVKYGANTSV
ncbi:MAG: hypothetical protein QF824_03670 [Candidatus Woesearchaeota archaeon]|jgi:hypothetical protein|nr:hypothetical protein [Candidatus Woesearchaeota archaeon]